ncbi:sialic acid-binding Ig-like lectin 13 [Emydura macquarii macquarii]|uniref:sialic acid-binding Ig-like lectin 13 n=1 Tax=Emydura macquarii macquarii TaxID=1129001 RepID=UPI003529F935
MLEQVTHSAVVTEGYYSRFKGILYFVYSPNYPPGPPNITWTLTRNKHPVLGLDMRGAEGNGLSLETQEGDSLTLICEAGSKPVATLSWTKANESLSPGPGGVGRLELWNFSRGDAGVYRCWAKNRYGSASWALRVHVQGTSPHTQYWPLEPGFTVHPNRAPAVLVRCSQPTRTRDSRISAPGLSQPDAPAMGRALPPCQDAGEEEIVAQGPSHGTGGVNPAAAMLRALLLALLWRGSLAQEPGYSLTVPRSVSVQEGLCVLVPCNFTYPARYIRENPQDKLYGHWFKGSADVGRDPPVASSDPSREVSQETRGRFRLVGDSARGDCSLQIDNARQTDGGSYFLRVERGSFKLSYRVSTGYTEPEIYVRVSGLTEKPEIQILPALGLPETLVAGEPVTVTCTAPGRCSGTSPQISWTGPFSNTARDVSVSPANGTRAHSSELRFTPARGDDGKNLTCTVTYSPAPGPSTSRAVSLQVGYPPRPPNITWTLTRNKHPVLGPVVRGAEGDGLSLETQEGDSLTLICEAGSKPVATLSWTKANESLSPGLGGVGRLELWNLSRGDAGVYRCWARNPYGSASRALRLHVQAPRGGRTRAFIEISCKLVFMATGFVLAYYLTLLYYRRTPCCCHGRRRKYRPETLVAATHLPASPSRLE